MKERREKRRLQMSSKQKESDKNSRGKNREEDRDRGLPLKLIAVSESHYLLLRLFLQRPSRTFDPLNLTFWGLGKSFPSSPYSYSYRPFILAEHGRIREARDQQS